MANHTNSENKKKLRDLEKIASTIYALEGKYGKMTDEQLGVQTLQLRNKITELTNKGMTESQALDAILPEAYAVVRESIRRVFKDERIDPTHEQILGGIAMHQGRICEMATGEGKTIASTFPVYLNAIMGKGVHVVTTNETLAMRDAENMGKLFVFLNLSAGWVVEGQTTQVKKIAYGRVPYNEKGDKIDITYGTANEFCADFLRDSIAMSESAIVQRDGRPNFVLIDEADSILIDVALTPHIIAETSNVDFDAELCQRAHVFVEGLEGRDITGMQEYSPDDDEECDYAYDSEKKSVILTDRGDRKAEKFFEAFEKEAFDKASKEKNPDEPHFTALQKALPYIKNALYAKEILHRGTDYEVVGGEVKLIDNFTGRILERNRFKNGLHSALEVKESVVMQSETRSVAESTLQNYFKRYKKISGMTGTATAEKEEFETVYSLDIVTLDPSRRVQRANEGEHYFKTKNAKYAAIIERIKEEQKNGKDGKIRPILIGTGSVKESEELAKLLKDAGITFQILNATVGDKKTEDKIVNEAGKSGAVTISTQMAGRGTDIKLGGEGASKEDRDAIEALGGLLVIAAGHYDSARVDIQLIGRAGRQGQRGANVVYCSFEDHILKELATDKLRKIVANATDEDLQKPRVKKKIAKEIKKIQVVLGSKRYSVRKQQLLFDNVIEDQRTLFFSKRAEIMKAENVEQYLIGIAGDFAGKVWDEISLDKAFVGEENLKNWDIDRLNALLGEKLKLEQPIVSKNDLESKEAVVQVLTDKIITKIKDFTGKKYDSDIRQFQVKGGGKKDFCDEIGYDQIEKFILIDTMKSAWSDYLEALETVRMGINYEAYAGRKPIDEYRKQAVEMYENMNSVWGYQVLDTLINGDHKAIAKQYRRCYGTNYQPVQIEKAKTDEVAEDKKSTEQEKLPEQAGIATVKSDRNK